MSLDRFLHPTAKVQKLLKYESYSVQYLQNKTIKIKGLDRVANLKAEKNYTIVCNKNEQPNCSLNFNLPSQLTRVEENQVVGNVEIVINGKVEETINILSTDHYEEATLWDYFKDIINN